MIISRADKVGGLHPRIHDHLIIRHDSIISEELGRTVEGEDHMPRFVVLTNVLKRIFQTRA